jgi:hypothetical protein
MVARAHHEEPKSFKVVEPDPQTRLVQRQRNRAAIEALRRFRQSDDDGEQRETWDYLRQALDEDRPSYRKLFP